MKSQPFTVSNQIVQGRVLSPIVFIVYIGGLQTTTSGTNPAREAISSGPRSYFIRSQRHFVNNEKTK